MRRLMAATAVVAGLTGCGVGESALITTGASLVGGAGGSALGGLFTGNQSPEEVLAILQKVLAAKQGIEDGAGNEKLDALKQVLTDVEAAQVFWQALDGTFGENRGLVDDPAAAFRPGIGAEGEPSAPAAPDFDSARQRLEDLKVKTGGV